MGAVFHLSYITEDNASHVLHFGRATTNLDPAARIGDSVREPGAEQPSRGGAMGRDIAPRYGERKRDGGAGKTPACRPYRCGP